ncbi:hypothetical protein PHYSODRAFT_500558 [Phytophthora sojae]|uniref:Rab-GAP TBC domain-containing protein n=1 Tax=Phytophthora sojae (strain P6497) TaxID=1094619 RepID=G4ZEZ1_PHYSP|nr:hypothetical protein PHYSODRAFT_500558 [Phytophthora sojae]EGZ17903.1 hypothetical protein PHYSODRAFT_500558 [Phytophthora sojae]|eukprot:XP_009526961.1 hypothetical protein PHYSODRAFT_500558 [Phytophthora sojae]
MGLEERALVLTERLIALDQVKEWKHLVKTELAQPEYPLDQVQSLRPSTTVENPLMYCLLEKMGLLGLIKRTVIDLHCEAMQSVAAASKKQVKLASDDSRLLPGAQTTNGCSLDVVRAARDNWERITSDEMLRVAKELGRPLGTKPAKATKVLAARFLYDGNDLLRSLQAIEPSNRVREPAETATDAWGSIQLQLYSPPFHEYRRLFPELAPGCGQIGLDELFPAQRSAFLAEKNRVGDLVLAHQSVSMARQYSKTGCPVSLRPQIWRQVLSVPVTTQDRSHFEHLKTQAAQWTYLTDDMYLLDLQQTIDSSDYFVFQDHLESVLMAFTRDTYVKGHALQVNGTVHGSLAGTESKPDEAANEDSDSSVPPNGVLPFSGLVMYMAPLAYLYADPVELYIIFRELYARYWSKLNAIRTERGTILPLCKLFEDLVVRSSPAAVFHLINIGVKPLDIAFPWIQSAFSGTLDIDQVLLLWDRVIGYDSLELVAIFAAALFHFRASELETVNSREEAEELFAELIDIHVVTLLQEYLFGLP